MISPAAAPRETSMQELQSYLGVRWFPASSDRVHVVTNPVSARVITLKKTVTTRWFSEQSDRFFVE